jgi:hypothetical protein
MGERTMVFPGPEQLEGYARKAGLPLKRFWNMIEAELSRHPNARQIVIRGPKQAITINIARDSRQIEREVFDGAELKGKPNAHETETDIFDPHVKGVPAENDICDMNRTIRERHNRTPYDLVKEVKTPRYKIPEERPNIFANRRSEESRERTRLFREKWAEANMTHDWPSWLVGELDDNERRTPIQGHIEIEDTESPRRLKYVPAGSVRRRSNSNLTQVLEFMYPNMLTSDEEKRQAAITLESLYVFLKGHQPSEDSPLYGIKDKSIAKRVQRFLIEAEKWWKLQAFISECESACISAEANALKFGDESEDDDEDDLVRLWKNRLDD